MFFNKIIPIQVWFGGFVLVLVLVLSILTSGGKREDNVAGQGGEDETAGGGGGVGYGGAGGLAPGPRQGEEEETVSLLGLVGQGSGLDGGDQQDDQQQGADQLHHHYSVQQHKLA